MYYMVVCVKCSFPDFYPISILFLLFQMSQLKTLGYESFLVSATRDGGIRTSGTERGEMFITQSEDVRHRFIQFCRSEGNGYKSLL